MKDKRAAAHKTITRLFALLPEEVHTEVDKPVLHVEERLPVWAREEIWDSRRFERHLRRYPR